MKETIYFDVLKLERVILKTLRGIPGRNWWQSGETE